MSVRSLPARQAATPFSIYEAVHLHPRTHRGLVVLWAPATIGKRTIRQKRDRLTGKTEAVERSARRLPYAELFDEEVQLEPLRSPSELPSALNYVLEPEVPLESFRFFDSEDPFIEQMAYTPIVPTENSPLLKRALSDLMVASGTSTSLALVGSSPLITIIGTGVGFVAVRSVGALSGALWRGAEAEVEAFGRDSARFVLAVVRSRLGLPPREPLPTDIGSAGR